MLIILFILATCNNVLRETFAKEEDKTTEDGKKYTTKYDNVDIDAIIKSERLLKVYVGCLLDRNPCTPDAMELKRNLPDALSTNCSSCSEAQKIAADKLSHHLIDEKPMEWSRLEKKYDPDGGYRRLYLENKSNDGDGDGDGDDDKSDNNRDNGKMNYSKGTKLNP